MADLKRAPSEKPTDTTPSLQRFVSAKPTRVASTKASSLNAIISLNSPGDWLLEPASLVLEYPTLERHADLYTEKFAQKVPHVNFIGMNKEFNLVNVLLKQGGADPSDNFGEFLNERAGPDYTYYPVTNPSFIGDLMALETKHSFRVDNMKLAVLYVTAGQTDMPTIFANKPPENNRFWNFLEILGEKVDMTKWDRYRGDLGKSGTDVQITSYFTDWQNIQIMFHIAPCMDSEQHRRLVGNDIGVIIYFDCEDIHTPFVPFKPDAMGIVPHVFAVVQPGRATNAYRMGFFCRPNVPAHGPSNPPTTHYFDASSMKNYLLTKLHNGYAAARACPPMKNLFTVPRKAALKDLAEKYPKDTKKGMTTSKKPKSSSAVEKQKEARITVLKGKGLAAKDSNGLSDPYMIVRIGDQHFKTKTKEKTLDPVWEETFTFNVSDLDENITPVRFVCMDWDKTSKDDYMGEFTVLLRDLSGRTPEGEEHITTHSLTSTTGEFVSGVITVSCKKVSSLPKNAPANLIFAEMLGSTSPAAPTSPTSKKT